MKTNTTSQAINPILIEALTKLRDVQIEIYKLCYDKSHPTHDCFDSHYLEFEDHLACAANDIGEMISVDVIGRHFCQQESEVCDA